MLLGDGCIYSGGPVTIGKRGAPLQTYPFFCMNHCEQQSDYAMWKAGLLDEALRKRGIERSCTFAKSKKHDRSRDRTYYGLYVRLKWSDYFRLLRQRTYIQMSGKEHLKNIEYLLGNIDSDLHTAIWFMDDGNEHRKKRKSVRGTILGYDNPYYRLCVYGWTAGQCEIMRAWFERHYKVAAKIILEPGRGEKCRVLYFSVADSKKLFHRFAPYFSQTESMKTKFWLSFARYLPDMTETPALQDEDIVQTTTP